MTDPSGRIAAKAGQLFGDFAPDVIASLRMVDCAGQAADRIHAALLMSSEGDRERLGEAIRLAEVDWRDLLVGTGLGHEDWPAMVDRFLDD